MPDRPEPSRDPLRTVEPVSAIATTNSGERGERTPTAGPTVTLQRDGTPLIAGYVVEAEIARGGMGRIYRGRELALDREVAIKTLLPGAQADRFVVESKITARLPHPGIPPVYALGNLKDVAPFLAMKLIRGRALADILKERASPADDLPRFVQIFEQIAQAVGFAHAQGIIHRDLKPNNIMVGAFGEVQVSHAEVLRG